MKLFCTFSVGVLVSQTQARQAVVSDDPAYAYCFAPDVNKKYHLQCNFCDKLLKGGITRMKYHLACITGFNAIKCKKVPADVKEEIIAFLTKKSGDKQKKKDEVQRVRSAINIENSDDERGSGDDSDFERNDVVLLKSTRGSGTSNSGAVVGSGSATIDKFYKKTSIEESVRNNQRGFNVSQKVQTKLSTMKREEKRDRVCEYICQFFYEASIPHNTVTLPSFAHMLESIGQFGKDLRGPSPYQMSGPFLQKRKQKVLDGFKNHKESWELTGCTVMTDAWTDKKGRGVMNLVVHSAHGVCFIDSVDCSGDRKDGKYIFDLVDKCIEDIGEENVV